MTSNNNQTVRDKPHSKWGWLIGLIIVCLGAAFYDHRAKQASKPVQNSQGNHKSAKQVVPVTVAKAKPTTMPVYLNGLGTVKGLNTVTVRPKVDGELLRVTFKEGQMVHAGQLLAEIDPRFYLVQLQQAEGQLKRDAALLKNTETDLARYQTLLKQDSISAQQAATQAALVKQYQGTVEVDRAAVANAKLQLSYAKIIAPISGRVGLRLVDQGNMVRTADSTGLVIITQVQPIGVTFTLPEDTLPVVMKSLRSGKKLMVEAYGRNGQQKLAQGQVVAIDNQIDLGTGTIKLKSEFANTDGALFANQFVNIKLLVDTLHNVLAIPAAALQNSPAGAFVYVVQDNQTVSVRKVLAGYQDGEQLVIQQGLQADEQVVVEGVDKLREGAQVKLITQASLGAFKPTAAPETKNQLQSPTGASVARQVP